MKQTMESFLFFSIANPTGFKQAAAHILPQLTTVDVMLDMLTQPPTLLNIGLSQTGLNALGIKDNLNDTDFAAGQFAEAPVLSESTDPWVAQFKGTNVHGVLMIASDEANLISGMTQSLKNTFGSSISILYSIQGQARPGNQAGHEREFTFDTFLRFRLNFYDRFWFFGWG